MVTNWTVVRIVAAAGILAGCCVGYTALLSRAAVTASAIADQSDTPEPPTTPAFKAHELRREVVMYGRFTSAQPHEVELPPRRAPRAMPASLPVLAHASSVGAPSGGLTASPAPAVRALASEELPALDELALLRQLGIDAKTPEEALYEKSGHRVPRSDRLQKVIAWDLDDGRRGASDELRRHARERVAKAELDRRSATVDAKATNALPQDWLVLIEKRADMRGLPLRRGIECQLKEDSSRLKRLDAVSSASRMLAVRLRKEATTEFILDHSIRTLRRRNPDPTNERACDDAVPALVQVLEVREVLDRLKLVAELAGVTGPQSSLALSRRAMYDLSRKVRGAAIEVLKDRPHDQWRKELLAGLRYPWPSVAEHAATALVGIRDTGAVPDLLGMLDEPDPTLPFVNEQGKWVVRELVRINHLRNCLACHAPAISSNDPVRGLVPVPNEPLPELYYDGPSAGLFVRADITYLRQDFSIMHPVKDHGPWPEMQRFDYLVRVRELSDEEAAKNHLPAAEVGRQYIAPDDQSYPQREAVLFALRKLTGLNAGQSAAQWRALVKK
jgi:hypothetical protein